MHVRVAVRGARVRVRCVWVCANARLMGLTTTAHATNTHQEQASARCTFILLLSLTALGTLCITHRSVRMVYPIHVKSVRSTSRHVLSCIQQVHQKQQPNPPSTTCTRWRKNMQPPSASCACLQRCLYRCSACVANSLLRCGTSRSMWAMHGACLGHAWRVPGAHAVHA